MQGTFDEKFTELRPYLYHLTAARNISRILRLRKLYCAATLLKAGKRPELIAKRRKQGRIVCVDGQQVHIRDQKPLHLKNMKLTDGWTFEQWLEHLNSFVFFWPGNAQGPIKPGVAHFNRYADERPAPRLIRIPTQDLLAANTNSPPRFSRYNSGAPRQSKGKPIPRGPDTFTCGSVFSQLHQPSAVVEVAFISSVKLPDTTELATICRANVLGQWNTAGAWRPLGLAKAPHALLAD